MPPRLSVRPGGARPRSDADGRRNQFRHFLEIKMDGHHVQFNVVRAGQLRLAQQNPEQHRDLIIRVAGYSDYFCDLSTALQEEIIARTEHESFSS